MSKPNAIPEGCHTVTPHLVVNDGAAAIEFYKKAFGAKEKGRSTGPDGKTIMHAEVWIGDSLIFINDEFPGMDSKSPRFVGGSPVTLHLYVNDVDNLWNQAIEAGAEVSMPLMDAFWGDRYGKLIDPFGHHWSLATHVEDVSMDEIAKRTEKMFGG